MNKFQWRTLSNHIAIMQLGFYLSLQNIRMTSENLIKRPSFHLFSWSKSSHTSRKAWHFIFVLRHKGNPHKQWNSNQQKLFWLLCFLTTVYRPNRNFYTRIKASTWPVNGLQKLPCLAFTAFELEGIFIEPHPL